MEKLLKAIRPFSRIISLIAFLSAAVITLIISCGSFPDSFLGVIGHLFSMVIFVGIFLVIPLLWLFKKDAVAKNCLMGYAVYWLISSSLNYTSTLSSFDTDLPAIVNVTYVILFLVGILFVGVMALVVLGRTINNVKLVEIGKLLLLITIPAMVFAFIFILVLDIDLGAAWSGYIDHINSFLIVPVAVVFGILSIEEK